MALHRLLKRQLKRMNLDEGVEPDKKQWMLFLERISQYYQETDQERYLLERSMALSSQELMEANQQLETAQMIAALGSWHYDDYQKKAFWSPELYRLIGRDLSLSAPDYPEFVALLHPNDREEFTRRANHALNHGTDYNMEIRVIQKDGKYRWFKIFGGTIGDRQLSGMVLDIDKDKRAEAAIKSLNQKLIDIARRAGMSEVASYILHNVGNVLNTANVAASVLKDKISEIKSLKLKQSVDMLLSHQHDASDFLNKDKKGKLLPEYLKAISDALTVEVEQSLQELLILEDALNHIRKIIATQHQKGTLHGVFEQVALKEMIDLSLKMSGCYKQSALIKINRDHILPLEIAADKTSLLQVLINLLQNASHAVMKQHPKGGGQIDIDVFEQEGNEVEIIIKDNGVGIDSKELDKIFEFGFTTRKDGHGFGLPGCAFLMRDMGGAILAKSDGTGKGATFILRLQRQPKENTGGLYETT